MLDVLLRRKASAPNFPFYEVWLPSTFLEGRSRNCRNIQKVQKTQKIHFFFFDFDDEDFDDEDFEAKDFEDSDFAGAEFGPDKKYAAIAIDKKTDTPPNRFKISSFLFSLGSLGS
eukprot:GHVP01057983.1.p1 GENE.GHVP01057983.1~~GHVP01057983.1.p1  ORF type:complete len:115 (+),score=30.27 GHVP01057983.1:1086-1430(+)